MISRYMIKWIFLASLTNATIFFIDFVYLSLSKYFQTLYSSKKCAQLLTFKNIKSSYYSSITERFFRTPGPKAKYFKRFIFVV